MADVQYLPKQESNHGETGYVQADDGVKIEVVEASKFYGRAGDEPKAPVGAPAKADEAPAEEAPAEETPKAKNK